MPDEIDVTPFDALTDREMDVLGLLAKGLSNQEIADELVIEVSTVKWYNAQVYSKLEVKNRKQAVIRARTLGILKADQDDMLHPAQHNLPADTLPFIGRDQEIQELIELTEREHSRLITILGPGGMGKSRLSIEIGRRLIPYFREGVYFISLAPVLAHEQIITTIADVIGFKFHSDLEPRQQLLDHIQPLNMLLLIDNFEHLVDHASLLTDILSSASGIHMIVTSREKLGLRGEQIYLINGLSTPTHDEIQTTGRDSVNLFIEVANRTTAKVRADDTKIIAQICRMLGGMPLAILLAAAWLDTLSLTEIEEELKQGPDILEGALRDMPERHQSIESVFDYSWDRLSSNEQTIFMYLSVFREGFTREAAKSVAGANIHDLQRLVHTSFIQHQSSGRYTVHELMRQYGELKLMESGAYDLVAEQHAQYFADVIAPLNQVTYGMQSSRILEPVNQDFENIRAAWTYQSHRKNFAELRRFIDGIWLYFDCYNRCQEGLDLFEPVLKTLNNSSDDETLFRGQLLARIASFYADIGEHQKSADVGYQALEILESYDSTDDIMHICHLFLLLMGWMGREEESDLFTRRLYALAQAHPETKWRIPAFLWMWPSYVGEERPEEALRWVEALPEYLWQTFSRAVLLGMLGQPHEKESVLLDALDKYWFSRIHYMFWYEQLTACAIQMENTEKAWLYIQRGLYYGDAGPRAWRSLSLLVVAVQVLIEEERYRLATEISSFTTNHPFVPGDVPQMILEFQETLKAHLSPEEYDEAWENGQKLDLSDVVTEILER